MSENKLFLICNSHIDPVWLWEWEEGLAETISTFRTAARFCREFDGFVFNHNEAVLYKWVEEYDSDLFHEIQELVKLKKWHIMGGWYLQPDCNVPAGESFVRQILFAKTYFLEKFGVEPNTAINFDPFGHSRGLVQILKKSGYDSYLFCRPDKKWLELPDDDFIWEGFDGSKVFVRRASEHYNSHKGKSAEKIKNWINGNTDKQTGMVLWGMGNHGGGPSRIDLENIDELKSVTKEYDIVHGTPEKYFENLDKDKLQAFSRDLNPWAVGCYTSMAEVKYKHRLLESTYYLTEKMCADLALQNLIDYPSGKLNEALEDMLYCEFHDILPGSAIQEVEEYAVRKLEHGLEILSRLKAKAFFKMTDALEPAKEGEFPLFIYNSHPVDIKKTVVIEFQPPEPNEDPSKYLQPELYNEQGESIVFQVEKESCNIENDQRKRLVFKADLKASSITRYSTYLKLINKKKTEIHNDNESDLRFKSEILDLIINRKTGLIDSYKVDDLEYLKRDALKALIMEDFPDPWGMKVKSFRNIIGEFKLLTPEESAEFAGLSISKLATVRIIEEGPVRTIVEALFKYNNSKLSVRYKIPKTGTEVEIEMRVFWFEKDKMLKLSIPSDFEDGLCTAQCVYGKQKFSSTGDEFVGQKWTAVQSADKSKVLTIVNNRTYGFDFCDGELRLSMLRSAAHAAHPVDGMEFIMKQDRFETRLDQGERLYKFWINAGNADEKLSQIDLESAINNEPMMKLCSFPSGKGKAPAQGIVLSNSSVFLGASKFSENGELFIVRLFETTGRNNQTLVTIPYLNIDFNVNLKPFEIKTIAIDPSSREIIDTDLLERKVPKNELE